MTSVAPIETVFGPLLFTRSGPWIAFRLSCRSYASEPERERQTMLDELESYAFAAEADFQLLRCWRRWDADSYAERRREHTPRRAQRQLYRRVLELHHRALERIAPRIPMVFLCVRLAEPKLDVQERAARLFEHDPAELLTRVRDRLRLRSHGSLDPRALADAYERAQTVQARVFDHLDAEMARTDELQWLICQGFCRSLGEPEIPGMDRPQALSPLWGEVPRVVPEQGNVLRWLAENGVERHSRYLKVTSELGDCYQAGLCLGEMRHSAAFSRQCELLFSALEEYSFPLDACLSVRWVSNAQALRRAERQIARTAHQLADEEQASVAGAKDSGYDRVALAHEAHSRLSETGEPWLEGTLSLICSAPTLDELEQRVRRVRKGFPHPLYRPHGDQLEIFLAHLPGQRCRVAGFERVFTCQQVGAMVPQATHQAGSESGHGLYVARSLRGRHPVLIDLREASGTDKSPLIALLGSLGGGKTLTMLELLYLAFVQGARVVDVDPKGDHRLHQLPELEGHAQAIVLGPDPEHRGALDPLRVAPQNERHEAAASFLGDILPAVDGAVISAINGAVGRVIEEAERQRRPELACCTRVIETLEHGQLDQEREAAYHLRQYCESGLAQLGFASVEDHLPQQASEQFTYLQIKALKRSHVQTVRSEMTQGQRHSSAVLQLVALYAMRILGEERDRLKVLGFDEASFMAADAVGQQLLDTLSRWGRSELAVPILSTQLIEDIDAQDNLVGQYLLFGMRSPREAARGLELLGLDPGDQLMIDKLTKRYRAGRALYRDLQGRCEEIQVELKEVDPRLFDALRTTPREEETFDDRERALDDELRA